MSDAGDVDLELRTSVVQLHNLTRGGTTLGVSVYWRPLGARRWEHFNLVPAEGQSIDELHRCARKAAQLVHAGEVEKLRADTWEWSHLDVTSS